MRRSLPYAGVAGDDAQADLTPIERAAVDEALGPLRRVFPLDAVRVTRVEPSEAIADRPAAAPQGRRDRTIPRSSPARTSALPFRGHRLTPADMAAHEALGISAQMLGRAQVRRVSDRDARELLGQARHTGDLAGLIYPHPDPRTGRAATLRLRRDHPDLEDGRPRNKYLSPYGGRRHLYFPPDCNTLLDDVGATVIVVEAEKSVLAITCAAESQGRRVLPIGLGGCWGWRGRIGKTTDAEGARVDEVGPLPDLDLVVSAHLKPRKSGLPSS
jgi:hypothetical protein